MGEMHVADVCSGGSRCVEWECMVGTQGTLDLRGAGGGWVQRSEGQGNPSSSPSIIKGPVIFV